MARNDGKAENQHYVPKMLLRNFAFEGLGKQPQIHVFDKHEDRTFVTGIGNVVAERGFNDVVLPDGSTRSVEPIFSDLETRAAGPLSKLVAARRLDALDSAEANWVAIFIAAQHLRSKNFREMARAFDDAVKSFIRRRGGEPDKVRGYKPFESDENVKEFSLIFFAKAMPGISEMLLRKTWALFETTMENPFWLSDNPVTLHNSRAFGPYGNLGFGVPGIEIHLPLEPTLTLALWCPSREAEFRTETEKGEQALGRMSQWMQPGVLPPAEEAALRKGELGVRELRSLLDNIEAGRATPCTPENVTFYNSLQVLHAERYLLSRTSDFTLARKMIADNPERRRGSRFQVNS